MVVTSWGCRSTTTPLHDSSRIMPPDSTRVIPHIRSPHSGQRGSGRPLKMPPGPLSCVLRILLVEWPPRLTQPPNLAGLELPPPSTFVQNGSERCFYLGVFAILTPFGSIGGGVSRLTPPGRVGGFAARQQPASGGWAVARDSRLLAQRVSKVGDHRPGTNRSVPGVLPRQRTTDNPRHAMPAACFAAGRLPDRSGRSGRSVWRRNHPYRTRRRAKRTACLTSSMWSRGRRP